jgi:virulence factor Mce-like protein
MRAEPEHVWWAVRMSEMFNRLSKRFGLPVVITGGVIVLVAALFVASSLYDVFFSQPTYTVSAQFSATPGLYAGNKVDILGVPTGTIKSVTARDGYVEVKMSLPTNVKIPSTGKAVLMAPNPVSDRFVEIAPAYTGGPVLPHGATITLNNTVVPLELDDVYNSVINFSKELGPQGANSDGALSQALHAFATLVDGGGATVHSAITAIAAALPALTAHPDQLQKLISGLDTLTNTLAQRSSTINSLYTDLASATSSFANDRAAIAAAVSNLQAGLSQLSTFVQTNKNNISGSVKNLASTIQAVMAEQHALIQTFDVAPLGFQNVNRAVSSHLNCVDTKSQNCGGAFVRLNFAAGALSIVQLYCGNSAISSMVPILGATAGVSQAKAVDTVCLAEDAILGGRSGAPGEPKTPDFGLSQYLGG